MSCRKFYGAEVAPPRPKMRVGFATECVFGERERYDAAKTDLYERIRRGGVQQVRSSSHRRDAYNIAVVVTTFNNIIDAHFTRPCRRWPRHTRREIGRGAEMRFVTLLGSMGDDGGIGDLGRVHRACARVALVPRLTVFN